MPKRVGIWGGSFDPVHIGHLLLAQEAVTACRLDHLIWIPSGAPPHKQGPVASAEDRVQMVSAAIEGCPEFSVSRIEIEREGKSYTLQTIRDLRVQFSRDVVFCLLIGADNAVDFESWHEPEQVLDLAEVVVFGRPGFGLEGVGEAFRTRMQFLDTPLFEVSSTGVRDRVRDGLPIRFWVPEPVRHYIETHGLYGQEGGSDG